MSTPHSIPNELVPAILAHYSTPNELGKARNLDDLVEWLWSEHRVRTSRTSVWRLMQDFRRERTEILRTVVTEKLAPTITADLEALEELRLAARTGWDGNEDPKERARFMGVELRVIETKLRFAGVDPANESLEGSSVEELSAQLLNRRPPPIGFRSDEPDNDESKGAK
jgi:hypothetical protein